MGFCSERFIKIYKGDGENIMSDKRIRARARDIILVVLLLGAMAFSVFCLSPILSSEEHHLKRIEYLDSKKSDVMELTTISAAASVIISALPDDTASPIANQLADLSDYFLVILTATYIEKFLVTILGAIVFKYVLPLACVLIIIAILGKSYTVRSLGIKLMVFGIAVYLVIPAGLSLSMKIEQTNAMSIQTTMDNAKQTIEDIKAAQTENDDSSEFVKFFKNIGSSVTASIEYAKSIVNTTIDAVAVHFATCLGIPALIAVSFIPLTNMIVGIEIQPKAVDIVNRKTTGRRHDRDTAFSRDTNENLEIL